MSVTPSSTVVGVFRDRSMAEQAADALSNAGFEREQIHYSIPGNSGGFLEDLKSLFTGTSDDGSDLANDLTDLGLSNEEVQYYSNEYNNGNTILAVRAAGREEEAQGILHQYGAYNAGMEPGFFKETTNEVQQPSTYTQQDSYPTSEQPGSAQNWDTSPQPNTTEERPLEERQQDMATPQSEMEYPPAPQVAPTYDSAGDNTHTGVSARESDAYYQSEQPATATPQYDAEQQAPQANVDTSGQEVETPVSQASVGVPEQEAEKPTPQPGVVSTVSSDELQQLLAQIQATRQQLQEAKARLQAAKEQEAQLKTTREREQIQAASQELQEAQAELQATLTELRETQERMGQYQ